MSQQSQTEKANLYAFSPFVTIKNTVARGKKKTVKREQLEQKQPKKMYPKLFKAATHTSSMTDLIRTKKINKKHDADEADQGDSGWVGR